MYWNDEGYLLGKNNFDENSIIIETFTLNHGKHSGIVYGGSSRKQRRNFQIGNKMLLHWRSKNENKSGYFNFELIKPIGPLFFDDKKRSTCILSATSILKILLPERQVNRRIYLSFENVLENLKFNNWIKFYLEWELSLVKDLGYENNSTFKVPKIYMEKNKDISINKNDIKEAFFFNKNLLIENFISPNRLKFPLFRNLLESYFN